jgi:ubiquinone/menaquinone biosynthesis C-methylase UbiE
MAKSYETVRYKNKWAKAYHHWWFDTMLTEVRKQDLILDNGCGVGLSYDHLPGANIIGMDSSPQMIRISGRKTDRLLVADSQNIPFADENFDIVVSRGLLHHLPDLRKGLAEMARVLRTGGEVVAVETNSSFLSSLPRKIIYRSDHFTGEHENLNRHELTAEFKKYFQIKQVRFFGFLAYPILGFPDIVDLFRYFPAKKLSYHFLMTFDRLLSFVPFIRTQAWAILIRATRRL